MNILVELAILSVVVVLMWMAFGWDANPWVFVYEFERCTDEAKKTE